MAKSLGFEVALPLPFDAALTATRDALKTEGFGVLSEIDMRGAFKEKLGKEFRPYVILGACNPPLAYAAMSADPSVGLLLPCNVTVEADGPTRATVRLTDPEVLLGSLMVGAPAALAEVARDARERIVRAVRTLEQRRS